MTAQTAAELFHKADDRLFAAKLVRQNRATVIALADRRPKPAPAVQALAQRGAAAPGRPAHAGGA